VGVSEDVSDRKAETLPEVEGNARMAYADINIEAPEAHLTKDALPEELYRIGLIYSEGMDVAVDLVAAHKWFNLAASRGHREARLCRQEMAEMMSGDEVQKAQKAAREWMKKAN
jgi:uncharacterized protein